MIICTIAKIERAIVFESIDTSDNNLNSMEIKAIKIYIDGCINNALEVVGLYFHPTIGLDEEYLKEFIFRNSRTKILCGDTDTASNPSWIDWKAENFVETLNCPLTATHDKGNVLDEIKSL